MPVHETPKSLDVPGENSPLEIVERLQLSTCFMLATEMQIHGNRMYEMIKTSSRIGMIGAKAPDTTESAAELNKFEIDFLDLCDRAKDNASKWRYFSLLMSELLKRNRANLAIQLMNLVRHRSKKFNQTAGAMDPKSQGSIPPKRTAVLDEVNRLLDPILKGKNPGNKPPEGKK